MTSSDRPHDATTPQSQEYGPRPTYWYRLRFYDSISMWFMRRRLEKQKKRDGAAFRSEERADFRYTCGTPSGQTCSTGGVDDDFMRLSEELLVMKFAKKGLHVSQFKPDGYGIEWGYYTERFMDATFVVT